MTAEPPAPPDVLPAPVTGAQAWYGPDMAGRDEWLYELGAHELAEIDAAMRPLVERKADIAQIRRSDFPLPVLSRRLERIRHDLLHGRGFAVLRGLPVRHWSRREAATAYFGLGLHLGNPRSQNAAGHVLGHVSDLGRSLDDPATRTYQTAERQTFHTDSVDVVGLLCLHTARRGGESLLASSMTIYNEMYRQRPDLLRTLFEPFATDRRGEVPAGRKTHFSIPVFSWHEGYLSCMFARRYIESAQRFADVAPLGSRHRAALDMFERLAEDPAIHLHLEFRPGDMQFVHNHTMVHDRTAFEDWPEHDRRRHLLRLWLAVDGARPLPPVYAERYGSVTIGDRGGIVVPGTRMQAPLEPG